MREGKFVMVRALVVLVVVLAGWLRPPPPAWHPRASEVRAAAMQDERPATRDGEEDQTERPSGSTSRPAPPPPGTRPVDAPFLLGMTPAPRWVVTQLCSLTRPRRPAGARARMDGRALVRRARAGAHVPRMSDDPPAR